MILSIIIVNWNTRQHLLECLESIFTNTTASELEVVVVDNASTDGSAEAVTNLYSQVKLIQSRENTGFARANNLAVGLTTSKYLLLLNPDTLVHPGAIDRLIQYIAEHSDVAAVGPRLVYPDGSRQLSVWRRPTLFREWWRLFHLDRLYALSEYPPSRLNFEQARPVDVLHGACLLLRGDVVRSMGLFDEDYFMFSEEIDLCDRLGQAGWKLHWVPQAVITHKGGQSTRQVADAMFIELYRNKTKFFRKRRGQLAATFYKLILLQAALARYLTGQTLRLLRPRVHNPWIDTARQYGLLIAALPGL
jgi:GT2 family glycosyltransferase